MLGMYISAGVSLWRLIEHDFGDAEGANQGPALQVLYVLVVAQGVLFGYKTIFALAVGGSRLANVVAREFGIEVGKELVAKYLEETVAGCEKDPSFATGRNFVTYGVDLMMEAKSNEGFIAGIRVLGGAIKDMHPPGKMVLAKYLLTRLDSSSAIIQKLLEIVGPRSPYSREIKGHVLRIVDIIAPCIRLEQFPRAIECLCSVVDTSEESNQLQMNREDDDNDDGDVQIKCIETFARLKKDKARSKKLKDYERVEVLEEYEKDYINDVHMSLSDTILFHIERLLYGCLPCGLPIQHCLVGKRKPEENERK
ncbi:uncharacterized protein [Miscanthus floridulus]|uniref:uncharacterized protein n=1 Tax=Miscanthus floridulus TaxID=154761 RepID=UPI003459B18B